MQVILFRGQFTEDGTLSFNMREALRHLSANQIVLWSRRLSGSSTPTIQLRGAPVAGVHPINVGSSHGGVNNVIIENRLGAMETVEIIMSGTSDTVVDVVICAESGYAT